MATVNTSVNELVINKLTQAQYNALTEKSPTELYFVTDANESIQLETLPIASADNLNKIYQYVGETSETYTNGSFYKCVENITITLSMMNSFISSGASATLDSEKFASQNPIFADAVTSNTPYPVWRADYQEGGTWNVWTQTPNLSITADELASVWGITISGTPEVGDMIAVMKQEETTYAWTEVVLGEKLPDQTDNAGKFLTTDGTTTSWSDKPLVNNADNESSTPYKKLSIGGNSNLSTATWYTAVGNGAYVSEDGGIAIGGTFGEPGEYGGDNAARAEGGCAISIGYNCESTGSGSIAIGSSACTKGSCSIAIGELAVATATNAIAIGGYSGGKARAQATAECAIQLGCGTDTGQDCTNSDANTLKVGNANGNFEMMDANGKVPLDRLTYVTDQIGDISTVLDSINGETLEG